jgi:hypothetical protein
MDSLYHLLMKLKKKKDEIRRNLSWLIGRRSQMTIDNKLLIYKQILGPVWQYGAQLWGCSKLSNINIIQRFQNKYSGTLLTLHGMYKILTYVEILCIPWSINSAPEYFILKSLDKSVIHIIKKIAQNQEWRLHNHANTEAIQLLNYREATRRLNRTKPLELLVRVVIQVKNSVVLVEFAQDECRRMCEQIRTST